LGDGIVDSILDNVKKFIHEYKLDPLIIPPSSYAISKNIFGFDIYGNLTLHSGKLHGFSNFTRKGSSEFEYNAGENTKINWTTEFGKFSCTGGITVEIMNYKIENLVKFVVSRTEIDTSIKGELPMGSDLKGTGMQIETLKIKHIGKVSIDFKGPFGPLDWLAEWISFIIMNFTKSTVGSLLENALKTVFQMVLDRFN